MKKKRKDALQSQQISFEISLYLLLERTAAHILYALMLKSNEIKNNIFSFPRGNVRWGLQLDYQDTFYQVTSFFICYHSNFP